MAGNVSDEAFARYVNQIGNATLDQIEAAKAVQAENAKKGVLLSLGEVLVQQGVLTAAMRENVEKRLQAQQTGGIKKLGNYKLVKKLGEGGMGAVYLAEDLNVGRMVAVKVLPKKHAENQEFVTRFRREARAAGSLNHVNIVGAYMTGEDMGLHYIAMEYCEGETLDGILKRDKVIPWDAAIAVVMQVARGLKHAHEHGIIHRDIKPANIFICKSLNPSRDREGAVKPLADARGSDGPFAEGFVAKILDLGLSKNISGEEQSFYTQTGVAMGTPHYISPEQAKGDKSIDGRTDIYSLGATLYHLVSGQTPFTGTTAGVIMAKHLTEELTNPQDVNADIPDGVTHVIMRMMAKEPADRYADCKELLADLELVIDGKSPSSRALDAGKSSVAVAKTIRRAAVPSRDRKGAVRPLAHARGSESPRGARQQQPVAHFAKLREPGASEDAVDLAPAPNKKPLYIAAGILGLGAITFIAALAMRGGPEAGNPKIETKAKPETASAKTEQPAKTVPVAVVQPQTTNPQPRTGSWPLHDGKEPIADYAKRVGLPATETLDLGGGVKMEFVLIPAGKFLMGSPETEKGRKKDETQHEVNITKPFYMGKFEVTQEQYELVIGKNPSKFKGAKNPVECVFWHHMQEFCKKLSVKAGKTAQLPTEAQWEYACRAGTKTRFYCGDDASGVGSVAWYDSNSESRVHPVGEKKPNAWDLFDMHGNVLEWCADWYGDYASGAATDPVGLVGDQHVMRGGYCYADVLASRAANRTKRGENGTDSYMGFRVVVAVSPVGGVPAAVQPQTPNPKPQTGPWPLHDGKEPIADYAKRAGLPATETLDLGGGVKMEFVLVPPGEFMMGSNDKEAWPDEKPVHKVKISKPFYMGKYEVTQEQYETVTRTNLNSFPITRVNPSKFKGVKNPVEYMLWEDARMFCAILNRERRKAGGALANADGSDTVRLPTEAEWEYACRAGTKTAFHSGDAEHELESAAWYIGNAGGSTHQVGQKTPNAWGLHDMHGNVKEFCAGWLEKYTFDAATDPNPKGPAGQDDTHIVRGGSFSGAAKSCRAARRDKMPSGRGDVGFRVVVEVTAGRASVTAVQPQTTNPQPQTGPWPLHDGKEPIADYAKRAGLPATETLDLGGGVKMEMVLVPPGEFMMGADNEGGNEEKPAHKVKISKPFYMAKHETTVAQFRAFADAMKFQTEAEKCGKGHTWKDGTWKELGGINWRTPGFPQEDNCPACVITWNDAQEFVKWAAKKTGRNVCLPTEAQWEYACRAGTTTRYNTGEKDSDLEQAAWFNKNSGMHTNACGQKKANAWGLYDMHGNVWEWVQDYFNEKYYQESPAVDPRGPATGGERVLRGGGWDFIRGGCRSAHRFRPYPGGRYTHVGFRCAVDF